ncbi:MAG TPA: hypothetical protein VHG91_06565 [Longimicrobium sp.]|nr:hypothetical protein [Longimicrobium sp.]
MALRNFRDSEGHEWRVWDVYPYTMRREERRVTDRRRGSSDGYSGPERRSGQDRRSNRAASLLTPGLEAGWLCFENHVDKRRLTPIPAGWEEAGEGELETLVQQARSVVRRPV